MRSLVILGVLAATTFHPAASSPLLARDLERSVYKAPPATPPPPFIWTGFYGGGHAGAGWTGSGDVTFSASGLGDINPITLRSGSAVGFVGGGQAGYVWQFTPSWVLGVEGDISWTDIGSSDTAPITGTIPGANPAPIAGGTKGGKHHGYYPPDCDPPAPPAPPAAPAAVPLPAGSNLSTSRDLNWLASMRGRLGYSWHRMLFYVTGGVAWGNFSYAATASFVANASTSFSDTKTGWVIGGGAEWAFAPRWSLRAEYLHYEFDGISRTVPIAGSTVNFGWKDTSVDVVRTGLNYRFGEPTLWTRR